MKIILSNLPKDIGKSDIKSLMKEYGDVASVEILGEEDSESLESLVALKESDRVVVDAIVEKLNGTNWKGRKIGARALVFQEDNDAP